MAERSHHEFATSAKYKTDRGFTLIELLVVVVILGVLIAIAIPLYLNYRRGANDASAQSDMRNAVNVLEQCNTSNGKYPTVAFALPSPPVNVAGTCTTQTINLSAGTLLQYTPLGAGGASYIAAASNMNGAGKIFCYNSTVGGQIKTVTPGPTVTYANATC